MKRLLAVILLLLVSASITFGQDQSATNLYRPTATPPNPPCPYSRLFMNLSNEMALVSCTGTVTVIGSGGGGSGTVTSVALSLPAIFSVSGSPVTTSGTLSATLANQSANLVFSGPTTGSAAAPTFRALVTADIPNLDAAKITTGLIATARLGSGSANSSTFLRGDQTWAVPTLTLTGVMDAINAVRDHGCVGDDSTNNVTCLNNAITAAAASGGKRIYLRAGTYRVSSKITLPGGVTIVGDGREKTIIHGTANDTILELTSGSGVFAARGPSLLNLTVAGSSSGSNQIGVSVDAVSSFEETVIEDVTVRDTGGTGVYFGNVFSSTFKRIYASAPISGWPFLFNQTDVPGNTYEGLYAQDVNSTNPAGFRIRTGNIHCWGCNGINNSSSNSWWAIVGDKAGTDGAVTSRSAYFSCDNCNIESSKTGGILHYYNSSSHIDGRSQFIGDSGSSGTFIALKYEIDTSGGAIASSLPKGNIGPLVVFANSPLSYYANSEVIHANDLPPVTVEGDVRQADGTIITSYRNTTNSRSEKLYRIDDRRSVTTITASTNFTQPGAANIEANCASGCTLTLSNPALYASAERFVYIRNIGVGTLLVAANSPGTLNGGGSYSLASGESVQFMPHSASADYRLVGIGGSGVAMRVPYWSDVQRLTSSANLTYDGTTFLNQRAGGNPYFAANDTTNGITTRFGSLAGAPNRAIIGTTSNHPFGLYANNAERWTIGTAGHLTPGAATTYNIGSASLPINDLTIGGKLYWTGATVFDFSGAGSPEGVITAGIGSIYRRTDGTTGTTLYVKESGTGNTGWAPVGSGGGSGLTNLNGLTADPQVFAVGTSGTDFAISSATATHTFNLPDAGASARGVVSTGTQTFAGAKTVTSLFTANPGTTPTDAIELSVAALGTDGTRDSHGLVFTGRSRSGSQHTPQWKIQNNVTSDAGASTLEFSQQLDSGGYGVWFSVTDAGLVSSGDFAGDTFTAAVGFVGDGSAVTNLDAGQLVSGTVAANRGGAGSNNGILQANGSGTVGTVTVGTGLTYAGTTLSVNQGFSPTWTGSHIFTTTTIAREIDPQTDNTYDLGTTAVRWKTVHVGPGSLVVHNDATDTLKATLGFSGSTAQLITDAATPLKIAVGAGDGIQFATGGGVSVNGVTVSGSSSVFTVAASKTFTVNSTMTFNGTDGTTLSFPGITTTLAGVASTQTWTAIQTFNPGTTPQNTLLFDIAALAGGDATRDSHDITFTGRSRVSGVSHTPQWKQFIDVTTAAGISQYTFSYQFDSGGFTPLVIFKDDGTVSATAFEGSGSPLTDLNASELTSGSILYARMPLNVKSVCVCDGTTDDASALQSLVNTMVTGDTLSFEGCKTIKIGTQISIGDGSGTYGGTSSATASTINDVSIEGHNVTVEWAGSTTGVFLAAGPISRLRMRDISVDMNGNSGIAFDLNHARLSEFRNLYVLANADYGLRLRAYQVWTPGDGANGNSLDSIWISSTTAGAKGFDIGYTDTCTSCSTHLDVAQTSMRNLRARFDTGVGTWVSSSVGMRLNFTDAGQCDDCIFAAATAISINVPSGTSGTAYPAGYQFNTLSAQGTSSFTVTGTWAAVEKIGFTNYLTADGQTIPTDSNTYGTTSNGIRWGFGADAGYISGLQLEWVSTTQVKIKAGSAQIQSTGEIVTLPTDTMIGPSLSTNTWYYCYLYTSAGTPSVECVTTAPATAWFGNARSKTSNTARRYIGAIKTDGSSQIYNFFHNENTGYVQWLEDTTASPFRVIASGTATTETSVDCTSVAPATARQIQLRTINTSTPTGNVFIRPFSGAANVLTVRVNADLITPATVTSGQLFYYLYNVSPSGAFFGDVIGYFDFR